MAAERLFRAKVIRFLSDEGLLSEERVQLLDSWRHSGFSVHNSVTVGAGDTGGVDRLARYLLHAPLSSERLAYDEEQGTVHYTPKRARHSRMAEEQHDPLDFLARLLMHVPEPRLHLVRYRGHYSSVARARRRVEAAADASPPRSTVADGDLPSAAERRRLRRQWAKLIRRVYESDPLLCECGETMRVISFITDPAVVGKILHHVGENRPGNGRDPPGKRRERAS